MPFAHTSTGRSVRELDTACLDVVNRPVDLLDGVVQLCSGALRDEAVVTGRLLPKGGAYFCEEGVIGGLGGVQ